MIQLGSFFSVTVFVFLAGMTAYLSIEKHYEESLVKELFRRVKNILIPYAIATAVYIAIAHRFFSLDIYLDRLVHFSASGPFYFVVFFTQLIVLSPILYSFLKKCGNSHAKLLILTGLVVYISSVFTFKTHILEVHGGGKVLLGGSYLFIYFMGMLFASGHIRFKSVRVELISSVVAAIFWFTWLKYFNGHFFTLEKSITLWGTGFNPPSITLLMLSLLTLWFLFSFFLLLEDCSFSVCHKLVFFLSFMGKKTLSIFLYHCLYLSYVLPLYNFDNIWVKRVVYMSVMIGCPVIANVLYHRGKNWLLG